MEYELYAKKLVDERDNIIPAYGYGSGFIHQSGYKSDTKKSLDLIFVVDDIKKWNKKNFIANKKDYSKYTKAVFKITPKFILKSNTSVIYNVVTSKYEHDFKYGLIEKEDFLRDLYNWHHFYICGRTQKPIYTIKGDEELDEAIKYNRKIALISSLIILNKEKISLDELLEQICKLSYQGDVRTLFVENPNKIKNIVKGSKQALMDIYSLDEYIKIDGEVVFVNLKKVYEDIGILPKAFQSKFKGNCDEYGKVIKRVLTLKNLRESIAHPVKQFYISGFGTCKDYLKEKMKKKNIK